MLTGGFVAVMGALLPLRILAELVNIGTLLAFIIVCARGAYHAGDASPCREAVPGPAGAVRADHGESCSACC